MRTWSASQRTVDKRIPKELRRPITTAANRAMNQWEFIASTCNLFKAREKSRVQGAIGFTFASHWSFSHQSRTNRLSICAACVNSRRTLVDLFVWMDKSSSQNRFKDGQTDGLFVRKFIRAGFTLLVRLRQFVCQDDLFVSSVKTAIGWKPGARFCQSGTECTKKVSSYNPQ